MSYTLLDSSNAPMVGSGKRVKVTDAERKEADAAFKRMEKKWGFKPTKTIF